MTAGRAIRGRGRGNQALLCACVLLLSALLARPLLAMAQDDVQSMRSRIGIGLFRTMLASDLDLGNKVSADGQLQLLLFYRNDPSAAEAYAEALRQSGRGKEQGHIREWPIKVETGASLDTLGRSPPAAIYVVEAVSDEQLKGLVEYGVKNRILVFSSVEGHVEKGILGGLHIGVRALPYVNTHTLEQSQLRLKELFLKIAKPYG